MKFWNLKCPGNKTKRKHGLTSDLPCRRQGNGQVSRPDDQYPKTEFISSLWGLILCPAVGLGGRDGGQQCPCAGSDSQKPQAFSFWTVCVQAVGSSRCPSKPWPESLHIWQKRPVGVNDELTAKVWWLKCWSSKVKFNVTPRVVISASSMQYESVLYKCPMLKFSRHFKWVRCDMNRIRPWGVNSPKHSTECWLCLSVYFDYGL